MSEHNAPKYPTHAVKMVDDSMGDGDIIVVLAYKIDNVFYSHDTNNELLNYMGDEILNVWELNA